MRPQLAGRHGGDVGVAQEHLALGRIDQARDAARHRRLARARFADDAQRLAAADVEVDVDCAALHDARLLEEAAGRCRSCRASRCAARSAPSLPHAAMHAAGSTAPRRSASWCSRAAGRDRICSVGPISTSSPQRSTATRWAISATTPKSWVMNSTPVPWPACSSAISFRISRLGGDVERGGRLVGDQQHRIEHQRHGDHDALALAARELVRVGGVDALRLGQLHPRRGWRGSWPCARRRRAWCGCAAPRRSARRRS